MHKTTIIVLALCLCTTALTAQAATQTSNWYQVEVILFAQKAESLPQTESLHGNPAIRWPDQMVILKSLEKDPPTPEPGNTFRQDPLQPHTGNPGELSQPIDPGSESFILLPANRLQLIGFASRIRNSSDLRLLGHLGWRQPIGSGETAQPVLIQAGQRYGLESELEGTLSVGQNRYLHVSAQLIFSTFSRAVINKNIDWSVFTESQLSGDTRPQTGNWQITPENPLFNNEVAENYVRTQSVILDSSERINPGILTYLDHPLFGLAIRVAPFDPVMEMQPFKLENLPATVSSLTEISIAKSLPAYVQDAPITATIQAIAAE